MLRQYFRDGAKGAIHQLSTPRLTAALETSCFLATCAHRAPVSRFTADRLAAAVLEETRHRSSLPDLAEIS